MQDKTERKKKNQYGNVALRSDIILVHANTLEMALVEVQYGRGMHLYIQMSHKLSITQLFC